jgi:hypothetical protein
VTDLQTNDILAEHEKGTSLSINVLRVLLREGVDIEPISQRVQSRTLDPPRLDRVV